jgi:hypothetical protein
MRSAIKVSVTLAFALMITGCAGFKTELLDEDLKGTKKVAVVSNLGDKAFSAAVGIMAFGNHLSWRPVPDWEIDKLVSTTTATALTTAGYERVEVLSLPSKVQNLRLHEYTQAALSEASQRGFDTVVVIGQSSIPNMPFFLPGYGIFRYTGHQDSVAGKCHYVAYSLAIYRVATKELLAQPSGTSSGPCSGAKPGQVITDNSVQVKPSILDYSQSEMNSMRVGVVKEIERTLVPALRESRLIR